MVMHEITEQIYMQDPYLTYVLFWVTFSGLPVGYLRWETIHGIGNMVGKTDKDTPLSGHLKKNMWYNAKMQFNIRNRLPSGVPVMVADGKEAYIRLIFEHLPSDFCLLCLNIKHPTENCPSRDVQQVHVDASSLEATVNGKEAQQQTLPFVNKRDDFHDSHISLWLQE